MSRIRSNNGWRVPAILAIIGAVIAITTDWAYNALITAQNAAPNAPPPPQFAAIVPFVTAYIAGIAAAAILGAGLVAVDRGAPARTALSAAAAGSGALGFLAIFSVGAPLLVAGGLIAAAHFSIPSGRSTAAWASPLAGALVAIAVLIAGFTVAGVFFGS